MSGEHSPSLLPLSDALEQLLRDAQPKSPALWEDVSGGLHPIAADSGHEGAHAPIDSFSLDALDALSAGHDFSSDNDPFTDRLGLEDDAGYALVEDGDGRFVIDRTTGIVRLADPRYLISECGRAHEVRVRQPDGYEACFHLRIAEPLPEVVFSDGLDPFAAFAPPPATAFDDMLLMAPPAQPMQAWSEIAAAHGALRSRTHAAEFAPFGAALGESVRAFPAIAPAQFEMLGEDVPAPSSRHARWLDA